MTRREFGKKIGVGAAAVSLAIPALTRNSNAADNKSSKRMERPAAITHPGGQKGFEFVIVTPYPMMVAESKLIFGENSTRLYKDDRSLLMDKFLELNGMATVVVQLCNGGPYFDEIVNITAEIFNVSRNSISDSVFAFVKFLYEKGYVSFVSENAIPPQKRNGGGITVPSDKEPKLRILSQPEEKTALSF